MGCSGKYGCSVGGWRAEGGWLWGGGSDDAVEASISGQWSVAQRWTLVSTASTTTRPPNHSSNLRQTFSPFLHLTAHDQAMNHPTAPPARPHSAHAYMAVPSTLFRTASGRSGTSVRPPLGGRPNSARGSLSSSSIRQTEWEDAWDSSSDRDDDDDEPRTRASAAPIPIRAAASPSPPPAGNSGTNSGSISASWVSASFHPTPAKGTPPVANQGGQPVPRAVIGASPPAVTESFENGAATPPTKLPPGGAWEIVETAEAEEPQYHAGGAAGPEALRSDCDDVLRGE